MCHTLLANSLAVNQPLLLRKSYYTVHGLGDSVWRSTTTAWSLSPFLSKPVLPSGYQHNLSTTKEFLWVYNSGRRRR